MTELYYYEGEGSLAKVLLLSTLFPKLKFMFRHSDEQVRDYGIEEEGRWSNFMDCMPVDDGMLEVDMISDLKGFLSDADWRIYVHPDTEYFLLSLEHQILLPNGKEETDYNGGEE